MSDKQKLQKILNETSDTVSFETIVNRYLEENLNDFPLSRLRKLIKIIDGMVHILIARYENAILTSKEKLDYLSRYLNGQLYTSKEIAEQHVHVQLNNIKCAQEKCEFAMGGNRYD